MVKSSIEKVTTDKMLKKVSKVWNECAANMELGHFQEACDLLYPVLLKNTKYLNDNPSDFGYLVWERASQVAIL